MTNWYGAQTSEDIIVVKSNMRIVPRINLHGINRYSARNAKLLNGKVDIYSTITVRNNCDDEEEIVLEKDDYDITWCVNMTNPNQIIIDEEKLASLDGYLSAHTDATTLSMEADKYLQAGMDYEFIMNFKCNRNGFVCRSIDTTHVVHYRFSDIYCDIMGQETVNIDEIKLSDLAVYDLDLNGNRLTYDPDTSSVDHLSFSWRCIDNLFNESCDFMLERMFTPNT